MIILNMWGEYKTKLAFKLYNTSLLLNKLKSIKKKKPIKKYF